MNKDCIVLFPVYRPLDEGERRVVLRALEMTQGFEARLVAPRSFVPDGSFAGLEGIGTERFDDDFFSGIAGYNRLMLDEEFYRRFADFKYILIHQTDAYIFKPKLGDWCARDYDYIGAPWYNPRKLSRYEFWRKLLRRHKRLISCKYVARQARYNNVGNGGFSLRKTATMLEVLAGCDPALLEKYRREVSDVCNEDMFWSIRARAILPRYRVPDWEEGLRFAIERDPARALEALAGSLPFGCHAYRRIEPEVWKKVMPAEFF